MAHVPVYAQFILKLDADTMEVSIFPFKMQLLPPEYMEHAAEAKLEDVDATDDE